MNAIKYRTIACALIGGILGFLVSLVFWLIYFFQEFTLPVSPSERFVLSLADTLVFFVCIIGIMYWKAIRNFINPHDPQE